MVLSANLRSMATYESYKGLTLPEALLQLVEHHGNPQTRHLSQDEVTLLERAADWMDRNGCTVVVSP